MNRSEVYNFAAGPSALPQSVLEKAREDMLSYNGTGMSVMEMTHRGKDFMEIFTAAKEGLRDLLDVPDTHEILFLQGGATLQFAQIPMNLGKGNSADYAVTGHFSNKAAKEAGKYLSVNIACSTEAEGHNRIPAQEELISTDNAEYFYYCANNTIYGTEWQYVPKVKAPLVCDMSSDILTRPVNVSDYGLIFAGAQKNIAPAGLTMVIIDKRLAGYELPFTPQVMGYKTLIDNDSMLNTPPCWCIYMLKLVTEWIKAQGGISAMEALKKERAGVLYDFLDNSSIFMPHAMPGSRSYMNVTFRTGSAELDAEVVRQATERGLLNIKGHKVTGGIRASMYNAMPVEGAYALVDFLKEFEVTHSV